MRTRTLFLVVGLVVASVALGAVVAGVGVAGADCVGPQITYDVVPVGPGQIVHVTGEYWGTECYDTGNRPRGEGNLGKPQAGIEVVVLQDGVGPVAAHGDADADYRFVVDVPITGPLHAGTVIIAARADDPRPQFAFGPELPVSDVVAVATAPPDPVMFADAPHPDAANGDDGSTGRRWLLAAAALVAAIVIGLTGWGRRRASDPRRDGTRAP